MRKILGGVLLDLCSKNYPISFEKSLLGERGCATPEWVCKHEATRLGLA